MQPGPPPVSRLLIPLNIEILRKRFADCYIGFAVGSLGVRLLKFGYFLISQLVRVHFFGRSRRLQVKIIRRLAPDFDKGFAIRYARMRLLELLGLFIQSIAQGRIYCIYFRSEMQPEILRVCPGDFKQGVAIARLRVRFQEGRNRRLLESATQRFFAPVEFQSLRYQFALPLRQFPLPLRLPAPFRRAEPL